MSTQFDQLAADAMKLPLRDRVRLAQQLVSTIDDGNDSATTPEIEDLWFAEAQRRLEELHVGNVCGLDGDEVFRNAREALKQ